MLRLLIVSGPYQPLLIYHSNNLKFATVGMQKHNSTVSRLFTYQNKIQVLLHHE